MANQLIIYGEDHTTEYRETINEKIRKQHKLNPFEFLLLEELGPHVYLTEKQKEQAIKNHVYSIGPMGLQLALDLDIPVVGIDLWDDAVYLQDKYDSEGMALDFTRSFRLRENKMVITIEEWWKKGNCAVIVGDSHLRTVKTKELGPVSPLQFYFGKTPNAEIIRCPNREIE